MDWAASQSFVGWIKGRLAGHQSAAEDLSEDKVLLGDDVKRQRPLSGVATCDLCRRTILAGEEISIFRRDDRAVAVCSLCEERLLAQGFVRAA